jgi:hypothetical protein
MSPAIVALALGQAVRRLAVGWDSGGGRFAINVHITTCIRPAAAVVEQGDGDVGEPRLARRLAWRGFRNRPGGLHWPLS